MRLDFNDTLTILFLHGVKCTLCDYYLCRQSFTKKMLGCPWLASLVPRDAEAGEELPSIARLKALLFVAVR